MARSLARKILAVENFQTEYPRMKELHWGMGHPSKEFKKANCLLLARMGEKGFVHDGRI